MGFKKGHIPWNKKPDLFKECELCGKKFKIHYYRKNTARFCSMSCKSKWIFKNKNIREKFIEASKKRTGNKNNKWKGGPIKVKCAWCDKELLRFPSRLKKFKYHFCEANGECYAKWQIENRTGENSGGWQGGVSFEPYPPKFNKLLKRKIKERDNYKCQICGIPEEECITGLLIHHIDFYKNNNIYNNLITLCRSCHGKMQRNRDYWKNYFQKTTEVLNGRH